MGKRVELRERDLTTKTYCNRCEKLVQDDEFWYVALKQPGVYSSAEKMLESVSGEYDMSEFIDMAAIGKIFTTKTTDNRRGVSVYRGYFD